MSVHTLNEFDCWPGLRLSSVRLVDAPLSPFMITHIFDPTHLSMSSNILVSDNSFLYTGKGRLTKWQNLRRHDEICGEMSNVESELLNSMFVSAVVWLLR